MRTILAIFARDVRRIVKSPVALVVTCGVALIPSLYAWCNILANWDPYANTGNIQVAVANEDLGTDSTLVGHLDAGAQTVRKLRTNHQLGWRFVSKSDALNGVKSGEYYAAIVLPGDFSATLIGSVTGTTKRPHITYYVNEKENAIAPKITDTGATEIDEQINSTFVTAVADAVATEVKRSAQATTQSLDGAQSDVIADLNTTIDQLNSVRDELTHMSTSLSDAETTIAKAQDTNKQISADLATATGTANTTIGLLADAQTASQRFSTTLAKALDNGSVQLSSLHIGVNTATGQIVSGLNITQSAVNAVSQAMQKTCDKTDEFIDGLDRVLASSGLDHNSKEYQALAQQIADARTQLKQEQQLLDTFGNNADALIGDGTTTATTLGNTVAGLTADGANKLIDARDKLTGTIMPSLDSSFTSLSATSGSLIGTLDALGSLIGQSDGLLNQLDDTLRQTRTTLDSTIGALGDLEGNLDATRTDVAALSSSQTYEQITKLLGLNAASIGDFMGNPRASERNRRISDRQLRVRRHAVLHQPCAVGRRFRARGHLQTRSGPRRAHPQLHADARLSRALAAVHDSRLHAGDHRHRRRYRTRHPMCASDAVHPRRTARIVHIREHHLRARRYVPAHRQGGGRGSRDRADSGCLRPISD